MFYDYKRWWVAEADYLFGGLPIIFGIVISLMGGIILGAFIERSRESASRLGGIVAICAVTFFLSASAFMWNPLLYDSGAYLLAPLAGLIVGIPVYDHRGRLRKHGKSKFGYIFIAFLFLVLLFPFLSQEWNNPYDPYAVALRNNWFIIALIILGLYWLIRKSE